MLPETTAAFPILPLRTDPEARLNQAITPLETFPLTTALSAMSAVITAPEAICSAVILPEAIANCPTLPEAMLPLTTALFPI